MLNLARKPELHEKLVLLHILAGARWRCMHAVVRMPPGVLINIIPELHNIIAKL